jgi:hypothetical protein
MNRYITGIFSIANIYININISISILTYLYLPIILVKQPMIPRMFQVPEKSNTPIVRPSGCRSVFVKNIPYDTTEEEVTEVMKVSIKLSMYQSMYYSNSLCTSLIGLWSCYYC